MREAAKYVRPEPPYYSQQLYSEYLGPIVQEVITNKDAEPKPMLEEAAENFQKRFLDKIKVVR